LHCIALQQCNGSLPPSRPTRQPTRDILGKASERSIDRSIEPRKKRGRRRASFPKNSTVVVEVVVICRFLVSSRAERASWLAGGVSKRRNPLLAAVRASYVRGLQPATTKLRWLAGIVMSTDSTSLDAGCLDSSFCRSRTSLCLPSVRRVACRFRSKPASQPPK